MNALVLSEEDLERVVKRVLASINNTVLVDQNSAEERLGLKKQAYLRAARLNKFPSSKVGKIVRAELEDVKKWLMSGKRRLEEKPANDPNAKITKKGFTIR